MFILNNTPLLDTVYKCTDTEERKKLLLNGDAQDIPNISELLHNIPGDTASLRASLFLANSELFINSTDIEADAMYILDYEKRYNSVEDTQTRRAMHTGFVDLLEKKLLFAKHAENVVVINNRESSNVVAMYKALIKMFVNDKKALVTTGRIYRNVYTYIEDRGHASILFGELIADILTNSLFFAEINNTLLAFLDTLIAHGWTEDELKWLIYNESEFYIKRSLFAIESVMDILIIVKYVDEQVSNHSGLMKVYFNNIKQIVLNVVSDSIGNSVDIDDAIYISLEDLNVKIELLRSNYLLEESSGLINSESIHHFFRNANDCAEILLSYNQIYDRSDLYKEELIEANHELGFILIYATTDYPLDNSYKHLVDYINYCKESADIVRPVLIGLVNELMNDVYRKFEQAKFEIIDILRTTTGVDLWKFTDDGFMKNDKTIIKFNDLSNNESTAIHKKYKSKKEIIKYLTDPGRSTFHMVKELGRLADIQGPWYDGNAVHKVLEKYLFVENSNGLLQELYAMLFGEKILDKNLFDLRWCNILKYKTDLLPIYRYLHLPTLMSTSQITISNNNNVEDNMGDLIIEDFDFSDYNFAGTLLEDKNTVDGLTPFQIIRQIMNGELNLLKTNLSPLHKMYSDIIRIIKS